MIETLVTESDFEDEEYYPVKETKPPKEYKMSSREILMGLFGGLLIGVSSYLLSMIATGGV